MNFSRAVETINQSLLLMQPGKFDCVWIRKNCPKAYYFIIKNIKTVTDDIDWDLVISSLDRKFQTKWFGQYLVLDKKTEMYQNKKEVEVVLKHYYNKLYVFISCLNKEDLQWRNSIVVVFVRLAQKGNILAEKELISLVTCIIDEWMERSKVIRQWSGYTNDLEEQIKGCIRRYRYTGSFLGYLYRTLYYAGRGLRPLCAYSLDEIVPESNMRKIDQLLL